MEIGTESPRLHWKLRLLMGLMSAVIFTGTSFLFDNFLRGDTQTIESYIYGGLIFGLVMSFFIMYLNRKAGILNPINGDFLPLLSIGEQIEIEGPANLIFENEGVGGKIFMTDISLIFAPDQYNTQIGNRNIEYQSIEEISRRKSGLLIDNLIRVKTVDGKEFDFVVNDRETWIEKLNVQIKKYTVNNCRLD